MVKKAPTRCPYCTYKAPVPNITSRHVHSRHPRKWQRFRARFLSAKIRRAYSARPGWNGRRNGSTTPETQNRNPNPIIILCSNPAGATRIDRTIARLLQDLRPAARS
jgi:hypothetical protein